MKKKISTILLILVSAYILIQVIPFRNSTPDNAFIVKDNQPPLVIAHGGAKLMNPENTWMAFDYAFTLGVDVLEMDVRLTKDNQLATYHNDRIEDLSNGQGLPIDYTYAELSQFNFGNNFVDLSGQYPYKNLSEEALAQYKGALAPANIEQMFQVYGQQTLYIIEIKDSGVNGLKAADRLIEIIKKYHMEDYVCVASFDKEVMNYVLSLNIEGLITSFDFSSATGFVIANYAGYGAFTDYQHYGLQLPPSQYNIPLNTAYLTYKAHKQGMFIHYWTINDKEEMISCIKNKADGIITDRPDLLMDTLKELGY